MLTAAGAGEDHARFDARPDALWLTDLGGDGATTVNGDPVIRSAVDSGDEISFAGERYVVERVSALAWSRLVTLLALAAALVVAATWAGRALRVRAADQDGAPGAGSGSAQPASFDAGTGARVWYARSNPSDPGSPAILRGGPRILADPESRQA